MDRTVATQQAGGALLLREPGVGATLARALRHPATWLFAGLWLSALIILLVAGFASLLPFQLAVEAFVAALALGTLALTSGPAPQPVLRQQPAGLLWAQVAALAAVIVATQLVVPVSQALSLRLSYSIINPILYFVLPTLLLLPLGARLRDLNLGRGWRSWRVIALWAAPLLAVLAGALLFGASGSLIAAVIVSNTFQNGFFEEFLWRGALMSRLRLLLGNGWSIILTSVFFGLWHTRADMGMVNGNLVAAMALTIVSQAPIGLGFAIVVYRTRNLLASSVIHVLWDTAFQVLG